MEKQESSVQRISEFSINMWKEDNVRRGNMENKTLKEQDRFKNYIPWKEL